jgi:glycosyltransferase involved in cell wall biosynthesis
MGEANQHVVMLAHVFPRALDDSMGAFLFHLANALADRGASIDVVAPHAAGLANAEPYGKLRVQRFHYAPTGLERLAYTGTMNELVARSLVNKVLFVLFNLAYLEKTIQIAQAIKQTNLVIHAHWWMPGGLVGAIVSLVTRIPLVVTLHGTDVEMLRRTRWARSAAHFVFSRAQVITCVSSYLRDQLLELGVADAARIRVIPMPVNQEFVTRRPTAIRQSNLTLTVARLTEQKHIETLVDALGILRERGSAARLRIIGDGPHRETLERHVRQNKLTDRVEFAGALPQKELPNEYATCAVLVLPSIREGVGLVLAEALLCGAPVIAANSGGIPDIVQDGKTGLLFPERDGRALADAIEKLLCDPELAHRLAATGAEYVRSRFTEERVAAEFIHIYESLEHTHKP